MYLFSKNNGLYFLQGLVKNSVASFEKGSLVGKISSGNVEQPFKIRKVHSKDKKLLVLSHKIKITEKVYCT